LNTGKIKPNETPELALKRELHEELGILPLHYQEWKDSSHFYSKEDLMVKLHFFHVFKYEGELAPKEGQHIDFLKAGKKWTENFHKGDEEFQSDDGDGGNEDIKDKIFLDADIPVIKELMM